MKNIINLTSLSILLLLFFSCDRKKEEIVNTVNINPTKAEKSVLLSELVDSISYIKLETNPNCIMGNVREILIRKKYIYAIDQSQMIVFVFDKKGHFVSKLDKRGKGPNEYSRLGPVFVNDDENTIEVIDCLGDKSRILKYSNIKFELLKQYSFSAPSANSCRKENNIYYFSAQQIENLVNNKETNADIIVVANNKIQKTIFDKKIITKGNTFAPTSETFTTNKNGELYASLMYNNTFFKLSNMKASPILTVNFGKYGIDNSIGLKSTDEQMKYLKNVRGLASFPILNANNSELLTFSYYFEQNKENKLYQYLKIKKTNKVFHTQDFINDITDFPKKVYLSSYFFAVNHEVIYDDYLVDIILPWYHLKENEVKFNKLGKVKIQDNPIIMLMKLKKNI